MGSFHASLAHAGSKSQNSGLGSYSRHRPSFDANAACLTVFSLIFQRRRRRKRVETQIVYQDTSLYRDYVKWYQHVHGLNTAPTNSASLEGLDVDELRSWSEIYV